MKHLITCTSEELALLVGLCDYPGVGKGILESSLGKNQEKNGTQLQPQPSTSSF
ncbi:hypothetical protein QKW52_06060 [Bacillus sonorensis]|nr:hypothetical protein [Bacillus sonorensis]